MINIAELLKDTPKGMKLYSPLFGEVNFVGIDEQSDYPINVTDCKRNGKSFTEFGIYFADHPDAECLLFPSKDCRTWEGWKLPAEPKFGAGKWVVFNNSHNSIYQISEISDSYYMLTHTHGGSMPLPFSQGNFLRPWSIEDAKDGDVLAANECYVIFKEIDGLNIKCYCTYHYMGFNPSFHIDTLQNKTAFNPATKEQRDLLFKKMKEAGYEWDADKKELHKIKSHYDIANFHAGMPVLVRADNDCSWDYSVFSRITGNEYWHFSVCNGVSFTQCIPFEGNEHLLGTTDMCDECYINW